MLEDQQTFRFVVDEVQNPVAILDHQGDNFGIACIADRAKDNFRRRAMQQAQLPEVVVLRHMDVSMFGRVAPNARVVLSAQTKQVDTGRIGKVFREIADDANARILV